MKSDHRERLVEYINDFLLAAPYDNLGAEGFIADLKEQGFLIYQQDELVDWLLDHQPTSPG